MCLRQKTYDMIGRKLYYVIYLYLSINNFFYWLGKKIKCKKKLYNIYFISNNILYSFLRGVFRIQDNKNNIMVEKINTNELNLISVGDTDSNISKYINKLHYDYFIHLGDLCYMNDKKILLDDLSNQKNILVPGCRESIYTGHNIWNNKQINKFYKKKYYVKVIKTNTFIIKIIIFHNYVFLNSSEYYNIVDFLNKTNYIFSDYTILISHCPPYSVSRHGPDYIIRSMLDISTIKNNIDLYLSGHEHCYMHFNINDTVFLVNGLGGGRGKIYDFYSFDKNLKKKYNKRQSLLRIKINMKHIIVKLITIDEKLIDEIIIKNKKYSTN